MPVYKQDVTDNDSCGFFALCNAIQKHDPGFGLTPLQLKNKTPRTSYGTSEVARLGGHDQFTSVLEVNSLPYQVTALDGTGGTMLASMRREGAVFIALMESAITPKETNKANAGGEADSSSKVKRDRHFVVYSNYNKSSNTFTVTCSAHGKEFPGVAAAYKFYGFTGATSGDSYLYNLDRCMEITKKHHVIEISDISSSSPEMSSTPNADASANIGLLSKLFGYCGDCFGKSAQD